MKFPGLAACSEQIRAAKGNPVTANELLALLGRAWSRLLIFPGGLTAFGLIWLIGTLQNREPNPDGTRPGTTLSNTSDDSRWGRLGGS